jgi:hypothetical protein
MIYNSRRPTDNQVIKHGMELLRFGTLAGDLPDRLRDEFGLTSERARDLADRAIAFSKKPSLSRRGRMDTKPFDQGG